MDYNIFPSASYLTKMEEREEDESFFQSFESELDIEFTLHETLRDLFKPKPLTEISNELRNRWSKLQSQTGEWKEKLIAERDRFIKEKQKDIKEKLYAQKTLRLRDKITFVLGVTYIWTTTLVLAGFPNWMSLYYVTTIFPLISIRFFYYKAKKWHYFLALSSN